MLNSCFVNVRIVIGVVKVQYVDSFFLVLKLVSSFSILIEVWLTEITGL